MSVVLTRRNREFIRRMIAPAGIIIRAKCCAPPWRGSRTPKRPISIRRRSYPRRWPALTRWRRRRKRRSNERPCAPRGSNRPWTHEKDWDRDARFAYNHIMCPPMLLWLAEVLGVPPAVIKEAHAAGSGAGNKLPRQVAAIRKILPWSLIYTLLTMRNVRPNRRSKRGSTATGPADRRSKRLRGVGRLPATRRYQRN